MQEADGAANMLPWLLLKVEQRGMHPRIVCAFECGRFLL
jgi:hypothetical protein